MRIRTAGAVLLLGPLAGCGAGGGPSNQELATRAAAMGVPIELVYVTDLDGYHPAAGGAGAYGDRGFQLVYASDRGEDVRLTVTRQAMTAAGCAAVPIPAAEPPGAAVTCEQDGAGWRRTSGDRHEYAVAHGADLVRVSGKVDVTPLDVLSRAATDAHPASAAELDRVLPPLDRSRPVERGDLPRNGDGAPLDPTGPGG
jgi:hypothetical protein